MGDMIGDEALDEEIAVVVAGMAAQEERLAGIRAGGFEGLRAHAFTPTPMGQVTPVPSTPQ